MEKGSNSGSTHSTVLCITEESLKGTLGPFNNNFVPPRAKESSSKTVEDFGTFLGWIPLSLQKYTGLVLTLIASLFLSLVVLIVKVLNAPEFGFHSYSASFWRYLGVVLPSIPLLLVVESRHAQEKKESVFASVWPLDFGNVRGDSEKYWTILGLMVRGILGASSVILRYYALEYLSIADASVITYATPVLVTILAHFCLGEKSGVIPVLAAIATFCGVLVMTRPPFLTGKESYDTENLIGIALASGSLVCSALIVIITRKLRKVDFSLMTLVFGVIGVTQSLILTQVFSEFQYPKGLTDTLLILGLMSLAFFGQMAIILALTMEQAGPVSLVRSCDVIFAFILQFIFLGVVPDALSAVGGIIVVTCISVTAIRKWLSTLPEDDEHRQRFRILLF